MPSLKKTKVPLSEKIEATRAKFLTFVSPKFDTITINLDGDILSENIESLFDIDNTPNGVQAGMSHIAAQYAYYANIKEKVDTSLSEVSAKAEAWFNDRYLEISSEFEKGTETFKKAQVQTRWSADFMAWENAKRKLQSAIAGCKVILHSLEIKQTMLSGLNAMIRSEQEAFRMGQHV